MKTLILLIVSLHLILPSQAQRIEQQGFSSTAALTEQKKEGQPYIVRQRIHKLIPGAGINRTRSTPDNNIHFFTSPNPFNDLLKLSVVSTTEGSFDLLIYDAIGKLVFSKKEAQRNKGETSLEFNLNHLPQGIYFIRIFLKSSDTVNYSFQSKKIIKI
jgi:hypothetical protein